MVPVIFVFHSEFADLRETAKNLGLGVMIEIQLNRCVNDLNNHWHFKYESINLSSFARLLSNSS